MRVNDNGQYVSDDGFWVWDGAAWVPADGSADAAPSTEATTPAAADPQATQEFPAVDYASDTTAATQAGATPADQGALASTDQVVPQVDSAHPMSPDGRHWWDGQQWHDVSTDSASLATAGLDEDAPAETTVTGWQGTDREVPETAAEPEPEPEPVVASAAEPARQLSPDGMWEWNGTQWVPAEAQAATPEPQREPEPATVAAARQLSPDGHWEWDGNAWVPAQQAAAAVPEGAHVSPDGHWWWDGSQWLPTGK